jgi:hypothetical protein
MTGTPPLPQWICAWAAPSRRECPKGVKVRVTFDGEPTHSAKQQRNGWRAILNNFTRHVEASR